MPEIGQSSINQVDIIAVQDHVREYGRDIFEDVLLGFDSAQFFHVEDGIKGTKVLTDFSVVGNMLSNWRKDYEDNPDAFKFTPSEISTYMGDWQFSIIPAEYESSYLGMFRRKGQKVEDIPFLTYCMNGAVMKAKTELNEAIFWGKRDPSVTGDFKKIFDGIGTIIGKMKTAGTLTETALGTPDASNILAHEKALYLSLHPAVRKQPLYLHMGTELGMIHDEAYFEKFKNATAGGGNPYSWMRNITIARHDALTGDEMALTPQNNFVMAVDDESDMSNINVREKGKGFWYWADYRIGAQIRHKNPKYLAVNDKWAAVA